MKTEDIVLASTLKTLGYKMLAIEKFGPKGRFEFEGVTERFLTDFDLGNIQVEPKSFNYNLRSLASSVKR